MDDASSVVPDCMPLVLLQVCLLWVLCSPPILWPLPLKFLSRLSVSFPPSPIPSLRLFSSRLLAVILVTKFLHSSLRLVCWLSFPPSSSARLVCWLSFPPSSSSSVFSSRLFRWLCPAVKFVLAVVPFSVWSAPLALFCNACPRIRPIPSTVKVHPSRRCCLCAYPCVTESRRHGHSQAPAPRGTPSSSVLSPVLCDNSPPLSRSSPSGPTPIRFWTWLASVFSVSLSISTISYPSPPRVRLLCLCAVWHPLCPS
jgi:hypothetical protein